jgi:hypothetical protein
MQVGVQQPLITLHNDKYKFVDIGIDLKIGLLWFMWSHFWWIQKCGLFSVVLMNDVMILALDLWPKLRHEKWRESK